MALLQMKVDTEHPVLFLSDASGASVIPDNTSAAFVTVTDTCICFWVLSYVDGVSTVIISDEKCNISGSDLFSGHLDCASGVMALTDSSGFAYINVPVEKGRVAVNISADHAIHPDWVWIKLDSFRSV